MGGQTTVGHVSCHVQQASSGLKHADLYTDCNEVHAGCHGFAVSIECAGPQARLLTDCCREQYLKGVRSV